jgi:hypothetical protein
VIIKNQKPFVPGISCLGNERLLLPTGRFTYSESAPAGARSDGDALGGAPMLQQERQIHNSVLVEHDTSHHGDCFLSVLWTALSADTTCP